jgi:diguanylate cyclase (GGDEF)-like protein
MAVGARGLSSWSPSVPRPTSIGSLAILGTGAPVGLETPIAERLRAAQLVAVTRHSWAMFGANLGNALVLAAAMVVGSRPIAALVWLAVFALYNVPWLRALMSRRGRQPPTAVSERAIFRAVLHAAGLGVIWGAAPVLFFDADRGDQLIIVSICVGMMCAGAFAMSTIPAAALAYLLPLSIGGMIGLLHDAREPAQAFTAPLVVSYAVVLIVGAYSHARTFCDRVIAQLRAELAARHDPLTGAHNRAAFNAALADAFDRLARFGERFSLMLVDLDHFKSVNQQWGRAAGDQLLRLAVSRLSDALGDHVFIARIGGDEFGLIIREDLDPARAAAWAADIACRFDAPFALDSGMARCAASLGVALAPADGCDAPSLLRAAEASLRRAHPVGDETTATAAFNATMTAHRRELTQDIRAAVSRGEFFLQYQPIQSLRDGRVEAFEALVRWRHPRLGMIPPAQFIDIAEKNGVVHELGEWILAEACREAANWPAAVRIAVNVSGRQLCDASIDRVVESALRQSGLPARRLQVEVTESAALASMSEATLALRRMHDRGVAIVLDDFGTGFSSFDHIRRLPVSRLKIDRAFVSGLPGDDRSAAIVDAVVHLARALGLGVTAEGIETEAQRAHLEKLGCSSGQGYLFARPLDARDARALLTAGEPRNLSVA